MSGKAGPSGRVSNDLSAAFPDKIQIHLHGPSAADRSLSSRPVPLIWSNASLRLLREAGLTGSFTGTLPLIPQQNVFLGLPLQLLDEEVVYLVRRGLAVVVNEQESYTAATQEEVTAWNAAWDVDRREQQAQAWQDKLLLKTKYTKKTPDDASAQLSKPSEEQLAALPWHYTIPSSSAASQGPPNSTIGHNLTWYTPKIYTKLSDLQQVYPYPATPAQVGSVALFEHLKSQNMWCMSGLRFGGHFSVYPGDPLRYHSHYTAQLVLPTDNISMAHLIANGRLGTAVKKTHLICHLSRFHVTIPAKQPEGVALNDLVAGKFDVAPPASAAIRDASDEGRVLADFNTWSLAWAGFGT